jgi:hypothetical protein
MTLLKEKTMLVHPVVIPGSGTRSWTVLGEDDVPVVPVDRFLAYLIHSRAQQPKFPRLMFHIV